MRRKLLDTGIKRASNLNTPSQTRCVVNSFVDDSALRFKRYLLEGQNQ